MDRRWPALLLLAALALPGCRIVDDVEPAPSGATDAPATEPAPVPAPPEPAAEEPTPTEEPGAEVGEGPVTDLETEPAESEEPAAESPAGPAEGEAEGDAQPAGDEAGAAPEPMDEGSAEPPAEAEAEAEPKSVEVPEPVAEPKPVDAGPLMARLSGATRSAVKSAGERAGAAAERARREEEHRLARQRAQLYLAAAEDHLRYLRSYLGRKNAEQAGLEASLVAVCLDGIRRNLSPQPAADELEFALAELHRFNAKDAASVAAAIKRATDRLRRAKAYLPAAAPPPGQPDQLTDGEADDLGASAEAGPGDDPAVLAREIDALLALVEKKQYASLRARLTQLVLEVGRPAEVEALDYCEVSSRSVDDAIRRRAWAGANRAAERMVNELTNLSSALGADEPEELGGLEAIGGN